MIVNEVQRTPFIAMPLKLCAHVYIYFDFPVIELKRKVINNLLFHLCIACLQASRTPALIDACGIGGILCGFGGEITEIAVESNHTRNCFEVFLVLSLLQRR